MNTSAHHLARSLHCFSDSHLSKHKMLLFLKFAISPVDPLTHCNDLGKIINRRSRFKHEIVLLSDATIQKSHSIAPFIGWLLIHRRLGDDKINMRVSKILVSIPEIRPIPHFYKKMQYFPHFFNKYGSSLIFPGNTIQSSLYISATT